MSFTIVPSIGTRYELYLRRLEYPANDLFVSPSQVADVTARINEHFDFDSLTRASSAELPLDTSHYKLKERCNAWYVLTLDSAGTLQREIDINLVVDDSN
jgi:hypothetical protein